MAATAPLTTLAVVVLVAVGIWRTVAGDNASAVPAFFVGVLVAVQAVVGWVIRRQRSRRTDRS